MCFSHSRDHFNSRVKEHMIHSVWLHTVLKLHMWLAGGGLDCLISLVADTSFLKDYTC